MIEIKLKNPDTGQFEECSVSTLTTPRLINGVEFDGSKNIVINEKEIAIQSEVPTDDGNKLWISGTQGVPSSPITVDWGNVNNKPNWTGFMPTSTLVGNANKVLTVNSGENAYEYKSLIWNDVGSKPSWIGYMPITSLSGNANKVLTVKTDETGYEYKAFSNVAGSDTQVMFNDNGALAGSADFTYNKTIKKFNAGETIYHYDYTICLGSKPLSDTLNQRVITINPLVRPSGLFKLNIGFNSGGGEDNSIVLAGANAGAGTRGLAIGNGCVVGSNKLGINNSELGFADNSNHLIEGDFSQRWVRFNGAVRKRVVNITSVSSINNGTATSATTNSITDTSKTYTANEFRNKFLVITGGVGVGQAMLITSNTDTTITTTKNFIVTPDNTSTYKIINGTTILGEKLNSEYYFDLTTEDHVVNLPSISSNYEGSDINFTIKTNPNSKKLYILTNSTDVIYPDNKQQKDLITPLQQHVFKHNTTSWVYEESKLDILQPIKLSTKDLVIDLYSKIYKIDVATATTITFNIDSSYTPILTGNSLTIELDINMTVASAITWPVNITWIGGAAPTFGSVAKYRLVFRTEDAGTTWLGNLAYTY